MKKMRQLKARDRPREKLREKGPESLSDRELIATIIGRGIQGRDVFEIAGDIVKQLVPGRDPPRYEDLEKIPGVGPAKAAQISACFELARRYPREESRNAYKISRPDDLLPMIREIRDRKQEHFVAVTMNGAGEVIRKRVITVGLLNHSLVHPREVFADAITDRAASIICVHNHPSGTLEPSPQDLEITRQLTEAGTILGIRLLDHLIVTRDGYLSFKERGFL